jgi:hypothetical protein
MTAVIKSILGIATTLLLQQPSINKAPRDFALRLELGCAGLDIVDTRAGTYVRTMSRGSQTARVGVPAALKDQLFTLVNDARFFETNSRVPGLGICEPSTHYRLQVTSGGKTHVVAWDDCHLGEPPPGADDASRMRALAEAILKPFKAMGSVRRLRQSDMYCL